EFCSACGAPVCATTPHLLAITVASFDDPSPFAPTMAIWLDRAQPWAVIPPNIARYPRNPPLSSGA
ncbi:MAG: aldehyde-activating protein, partial [Deltaproteobacteria bacterium]|nr:aldehyde-activating protein [Deltaproteobacteria bacterium]